MLNYKTIILLILVIPFYGCKDKVESKDSLGFFDISKNDDKIIFSYNIDGTGSSIYEMNIDGSGVKPIIMTTKNKSYLFPKYSPNNDKILFLEYDKRDKSKISICLSDLNGKNLQHLTQGGEMIIRAIFSKYTNEIIYSKANTYGKSSPIGKEQAKGMDLYTLEISTGMTQKITDLNSYGIFHIFEIDSLNILTHITGPTGGICLINKNSPKSYQRIVPKNNPRKDSSFYYTSIYSEKYDLMIFDSPYEIYTMDMQNKIANSLYYSNNAHIRLIRMFNTKPTLLFLIKGELAISSINLDGTGLRKIPINISKKN